MFSKRDNRTMNEYDDHLKVLLALRDFDGIEQMKKYTRGIFIKQQTLLIYPEGPDKDQVINEIESLQQCLLSEINNYDEWYHKVKEYMFTYSDKFSYYSEWVLPPTSHKIIENAIESVYSNRN